MEVILHWITQILVGVVLVEHLFFLYLEMFAWETLGKRTFKTLPAELFRPTRAMAANQGLYNGFLAAGLGWSLVIQDPVWSWKIAFFFLACVLVAGIYGAMTVSRRIFYIQGIPALLGLAGLMAQAWL